MAQTITDFKSFLEDAKEAVTELSDFTKKEEQLRMEELGWKNLWRRSRKQFRMPSARL